MSHSIGQPSPPNPFPPNSSNRLPAAEPCGQSNVKDDRRFSAPASDEYPFAADVADRRIVSTAGEPRQASQASGAVAEFPAGAGTVGLLVFTALVVVSQLYAAIPLADPVGAALGGDAAFALSTCFSATYALGFVLWGPLADHFGRRRTMLAGTILLTLATAGCAAAQSVPALAVLRGVQGITTSSFAPVALAYIAEAVEPRRRALSIGAISTAFLVAGIVGQVVPQALANWAGWTSAFLVSAAVLALCGAAIFVFVREPGRAPGLGLGRQFRQIGRLIRLPAMLTLCAAHITLLMCFIAMYTALGAHTASLGLSDSALMAIRLCGLPCMFAALAAGPLARRRGVSGLACTGFLLAAGGLVLEAAASSNVVALTAASLVFVTGIALAVPAMITLFGEVSAPHRASGMAINGLVLFIGASLGPLLARGLAFRPLTLCCAAILGAAAACLVAFSKIRRNAPAAN